MITKKQIDNKVNKINKRLQTIYKRMGKDTLAYSNMTKALFSKGIVRDIAEDGDWETLNIMRWVNTGDKSTHAKHTVDIPEKGIKAGDYLDIQMPLLSRSTKVWNAYAKKYGEKQMLAWLDELENLPTYLEHADRIAKELGTVSPTEDEIRNYARNEWQKDLDLSEAWRIIYELTMMNDDSPEASSLKERAYEIIERGRKVTSDVAKNALERDLYTLVSDYNSYRGRSGVKISKEAKELYTYRRSVESILYRKATAMDKRWIESQHNPAVQYNPLFDREQLWADVEAVKDYRRQFTQKELAELTARYSGSLFAEGDNWKF